MLVDQGRFQEALHPLQQTLVLASEDYEALRFLALSLERLGRNEEATANFERFLELCPEKFQRIRIQVTRHLEQLQQLRDRPDLAPPLPEVEELPLDRAPEERRVLMGLGLLVLLLLGLWLPIEKKPATKEPLPRNRTALFEKNAMMALRQDGTSASLLADLEQAPSNSPLPTPLLQAVADRLAAIGSSSAIEALGLLLSHRQEKVVLRTIRLLGEIDSLQSLEALVSMISRERSVAMPEATGEALEVLAASHSAIAARALVSGYAVAMRPSKTLRPLQIYRSQLRSALAHCDPELIQQSLAPRIERVQESEGSADKRVLAALEELQAEYE
jgi:tetratricopeptide (TPR) repeat protein